MFPLDENIFVDILRKLLTPVYITHRFIHHNILKSVSMISGKFKPQMLKSVIDVLEVKHFNI